MKKAVSSLLVETIEPSLVFWTERLGFSKAVEVPGDDGIAFVMLINGEIEVHLQTRASAVKDMPYFAGTQMPPTSFLYVDVEDVHGLYEKLKDCEIILPPEKTFYGATHFFLKEPGGHVLGLRRG